MKLFSILSLLILFSCCTPIPMTVVSETREEYAVIGIDPPKHVYLDLRRVQDGVVFKHVYVSKHCNDMCVKYGDVLTLTYGRYKRGDAEWESFDCYEISDKICNCK